MALNLVCAVLDRGPSDLAEMVVLLAIADSADKDSGEAWPSLPTVAARARQSVRSVHNVLARLRDGGWLTWENRVRPNGSKTSNVYTVNLERLGEASNKIRRATGAGLGRATGSGGDVQPVQVRDVQPVQVQNLSLKIEPKEPAALVLSGEEWARYCADALPGETRSEWLARCRAMPKIDSATWRQ